MPRAGRALRVALSAALWIGLLWSRAQARGTGLPIIILLLLQTASACSVVVVDLPSS